MRLLGKVTYLHPQSPYVGVEVPVYERDGSPLLIKPPLPDWKELDLGDVVEVERTDGGYHGWRVVSVAHVVAEAPKPRDGRVDYEGLVPGCFYRYVTNPRQPMHLCDGPYLIQQGSKPGVKALLRAPGGRSETIRARGKVWLQVDGMEWADLRPERLTLDDVVPGRFYRNAEVDGSKTLLIREVQGEKRGFLRGQCCGMQLANKPIWIEVDGKDW